MNSSMLSDDTGMPVGFETSIFAASGSSQRTPNVTPLSVHTALASVAAPVAGLPPPIAATNARPSAMLQQMSSSLPSMTGWAIAFFIMNGANASPLATSSASWKNAAKPLSDGTRASGRRINGKATVLQRRADAR